MSNIRYVIAKLERSESCGNLRFPGLRAARDRFVLPAFLQVRSTCLRVAASAKAGGGQAREDTNRIMQKFSTPYVLQHLTQKPIELINSATL